jgi:hypothetical protein
MSHLISCAIFLAAVESLGQGSVQDIDRDYQSLPIGASAPDVKLPGVDGEAHGLSDYASAKVLAVVFTCNSCPPSQLYEGRVEKLYQDYR